MVLLSFIAAAVLGVIGGAVIAPLTSLDYTSMATYTNEGLIAVSLGGLGSVYGALAGGLALGGGRGGSWRATCPRCSRPRSA